MTAKACLYRLMATFAAVTFSSGTTGTTLLPRGKGIFINKEGPGQSEDNRKDQKFC